MAIITHFPTLDTILGRWQSELGGDLNAYRNHCYRVANFCLALGDDDAETREIVSIAVAFHDLGIWSDRTYDYLGPSRRLARAHLEECGLVAWLDRIEAMIELHHKLRSSHFRLSDLVERFRQADWIDVTCGLLHFGLPAALIADVLATFPNAGFHRRLAQLSVQRFFTHPWNPLPMLRL